MSIEIVVQALVSGLLMGLIYALVAAGLSLIFGLMDVVNFAHGELLMAIDRCAFAADERDERRRGEVLFRGRAIRFAIDYYDRSLEWGSEDPGDPDVTTRVMTIMLPEDD